MQDLRGKRFAVGIAAAAMILFGIACTEEADPEDTAPDTETPTESPVESPQVGPEGVPLHPASEPHPSIDDAWITPGVSADELVEWYDEQMPVGEPLNEWEWCQRWYEESAPSRGYGKTGTTEWLSVFIVTEDEPPAVLIASDQSGPC